MRRAVLVSLLVLAWAVPTSSQEHGGNAGAPPKPDFSGTWVPVQRGGGKGGKVSDAPPPVLVIVHREPELKVTRRRALPGRVLTEELTLYMDGRGERNVRIPMVYTGQPPSEKDRRTEGREVESKTAWSKNRLVTRWTESQVVAGTPTYTDITERWELSADGKTLTRTVSIKPPRSPFRTIIVGSPFASEDKTVYRRAP